MDNYRIAMGQSYVSAAAFTILLPAPGSGTYTAPQTILISAEADAEILHTTDGSVPSNTGGGRTKAYSTPFELAQTGTVVAIARAPGKG